MVMRERYVDAQTVSDELGRGAEVLRQEVCDYREVAAGNATTNHHVHYCEVNEIIRYIRVMSVDLMDANADLIVYRNRAGTIAALTGTIALDGFTIEVFVEEALVAAQDFLRKDDSVYGILIRDGGSTESGDFAIYFGWMPDVADADGNHRTY